MVCEHERYTEKAALGYAKTAFNRCKVSAAKRDLAFNLDFDRFCSLLVANCTYCGAAPRVYGKEMLKRNGIDRFINTRGYEMDNCVACCGTCNYMKHDMSGFEFLKHLKTMWKHVELSSNG